MRYFRVLIISLTLHIILALSLTIFVPIQRLEPKQLTYIDLLEKPELPRRPHQPSSQEKQFARSTEVPDEMELKEKREARFASEEDRSVLEEQRARESGMTANRGANKPAPKSAARGKLDLTPTSPLEKGKREILTDPNSEGFQVGGLEKKDAEKEAPDGSRRLDLPNFASAEKGMSTVGELLPPDVRMGDFTALNTDRHLFYTFYARMEEKIRHRWEAYARAAFFNLPMEAKDHLRKSLWTTKLVVILDPNGNFVKAVLEESSGSRSLDNAPVQAFRDAGQFPNPPKEMVKEDGQIHIEYSFTVTLSPHVAASGRE
jgi:TonB family protein